MTLSKRIMQILAGFLWCVFASHTAQAQNEAVGYAVPLTNIIIDGNLSDWPDNMTRYPLTRVESGEKPEDEMDLSAAFRVGYDVGANALYVALEVRDQSTVIDSSETADWNTQDGCELYVSVADRRVTALQLHGHNKQNVLEGSHEVAFGGGQVEYQREGGVYQYEWRFDIAALSGGKTVLKDNMAVGLDVVANDMDEDGSFSWVTWGSGIVKYDSRDRTGTALLIRDRATSLGEISGQVRWVDTSAPAAGVSVRLTSKSHADYKPILIADQKGQFSGEVLVGTYTAVTMVQTRVPEEMVGVTISGGQSTRVDLVAHPVQGIAQPAAIETGSWRVYGTKEGLIGGAIDYIIPSQGHENNLHFLTPTGVVRFNGQTFEPVVFDPESDNRVGNVFTDRQGHLWYVTSKGLYVNNGRIWAHVDTSGSTHPQGQGALVPKLEDKVGNLWAGTHLYSVGGYVAQPVAHPEDREFAAVDSLRRHHVFRMHEDRHGKIWFATHRDVLIYDPSLGAPNTPTAWQTQMLPDGAPIRWTWDLIEDQQGLLWFATSRNGLVRYDPSAVGDAAWSVFTTADGLPSNDIRSVVEDVNGDIWCGTHFRGVMRFDGEQFHPLSESQRMYTDRTETLAKDSNGDLWFGGPGILVHYSATSMKTLSRMDGDNLVVKIEGQQDGSLWVRTQDHLSKLHNNTYLTFSEEDGLPKGWINDLFIDRKGHLWLAGDEGLFHYNGRFFTQKKPLNVSGVSEDQAGSVLVYRGQFLYWLKPEDEVVSLELSSSVRGRPQQDRKGHFWIPTAEGVIRYDGTDTTSITQANGLVGDQANVIYRDRDDVFWIGTGSGLSKYDAENDVFVNFTTDDGLGDNYITCIVQDHDGVYWFGTLGGGVTRYDGKTFQTLSENDGLPSNLINSVEPDGRDGMWIGTSNGLSHYRSDKKEKPRVEVGALIADQRYEKPAEMELASDLPLITIEMDGASFKTFPGDLVYRYRLVGYDDRWQTTRNRRVEYENLPMGDYTFEVQVVDRDLVYSKPTQLALTVHVPYERIGLWSGLGIAVVLLVVQATRIVRSNQRLSETNNALSSANHELFDVNQELQREQVLERLRGQAQGMQSSDEIGQIAEGVLKELKEFGLSVTIVSLTLVENEQQIIYATNQQGRVIEPVFGPHPVDSPVMKVKQDGELYFHNHLEGEDCKNTIRSGIRMGIPYFQNVPEEEWPDERHFYFVYFQDGWVLLIAPKPIAHEDLLVVKRFGETFGFAYARHKELQQKEEQNRRLIVEAAVNRIRAEVQEMDEAEDFEAILKLVTEDLKTVGLSFDACEIDLLNQPVDTPTMAHFEQDGFQYATYTLNPEGNVTTEAYHMVAPFPTVIRQTIDRFIKGEPWFGRSDDLSLVEVAAGSYGRLRLTSSTRDRFSGEEAVTLQEFSNAIALGYARYLDIRTIQEQTERKSAFLASMSHELRTPMNAIKGFTNLVLRRAGDVLPDRQKENLQKVDQASDHLLAMINDLLDLSKIEAGRMDVNVSTFDVEKLVASCVSTVSPLVQEGVDLSYDVPPEMGQVHTDEARVRQMLINLTSNAIKFTESGRIEVKARHEGDLLVLSVSDTGKGIPRDELPTIFDEYRQVEGLESRVQKGTGLGLSITNKFAELLGGTIGVESDEGKGSTFTVRIPMVHQG